MRRRGEPFFPGDDSSSDVPLLPLPVSYPPDSIDSTPEPEQSAPDPLAVPLPWDGYETFWITVLFFFALFTRFWLIHSPREPLASETTTLKAIASYYNHTFFLTDEPEQGYLIFADLAHRMEYDGVSLLNRSIDGLYDTTVYVSLRSISAFSSAISIPILFLTIRAFGGSRLFAVCGSIFALIEPSLISVARCMNPAGLVQLFGSLSFLSAALSHHFVFGSNYQIALVVAQGLLAGCGWSCGFAGFVFVHFASLWPLWRFKSTFQSLLSLLLSFLVLFGTGLAHVVCARQVSEDSARMSASFVAFSAANPNQTSLSLWHFVYAAELVSRRLWLWLSMSFRVSPGRFLLRMLLMDKWRIVWTNSGRHCLSFTNNWFTVPVALIAYCHVFLNRRLLGTDLVTALAFFLLMFMFISAVLHQSPEITDLHAVVLIACIVGPLVLEGKFRDKRAGQILAVAILAALVLFLDRVPIINGYINPAPYFPIGLKTDLLSRAV
jgi:hypothetical protein